MKNVNKVILLFAYSRSGGTLFNRCMATLPNVVMLSEVNKLGGGWGVEKEKSFTTVKSQAENWYNINIENTDFDLALPEFISKVNYIGKVPVIRDWCHVNFNPSVHNNFDPPNQLLTYKLLKNLTDLIPIWLVRDPIDVFISSKTQEVDTFFNNYREFVEKVLDTNPYLLRYESFCEHPLIEMRKLCEFTRIEFDKSFIYNYKNYMNVNGDVQLSDSRNLKDSEIKLYKRKIISKELINKININKDMMYSCEATGYLPNYYSKERGTSRIRTFIRRLF